MQNHSPLNDEPDGTLSSAQNGQNDPALENSSHTYIEPQYQEYAQPGTPANVAQPAHTPAILPNAPDAPTQAAGQPAPFPASAPPRSQPRYPPPTPQPGLIPPTPPTGYLPRLGAVQQPGYVPQPGYPQQPGYIPATPHPGYVPQPGYGPQALPPGYIPQPGYIPTTPQPGYMPPTPPPLAPRPRKSNWLAIVAAVLAVNGVLAGSSFGYSRFRLEAAARQP